MSITDQVQAIARDQYGLLRTAARAVDRRLEPAVGNSPALSSALDRVRAVLRDVDDRVTGVDRAAPEPAAAPKPPTEPTPKQATEPRSTPKSAKPSPTPEPAAEVDPEPVDEVEVDQLADELLEDETDHHAGELADNDDLRDVQARLRAKHALQEQHEQQT